MPKETSNNSTGASSSSGGVKRGRAKKEVPVPMPLEIPAPPSPPAEEIVSSSNASATDEQVQDEMPTFATELATVLEQLVSIKEAALVSIAALKKLEKRHVKEVKNARKRQKRNTPTSDDSRPNCIFKRPIPLNENLARLLNKMPGQTMKPTEITHLVNVYIDEHNLKNGNKRIIVDKMMSTCLGDVEGSAISYKDLQRGLFRIIKEIIETMKA